jgi:hypothetical protein
MRRRLIQLPEPPERARLSKDEWLGSIGVFLFVFVSTVPVVMPYSHVRLTNISFVAMPSGDGGADASAGRNANCPCRR